MTSSHAPEEAGLPASSSTFGLFTGLNFLQSAPAHLAAKSRFDFAGYKVQATDLLICWPVDLYSGPGESEG